LGVSPDRGAVAGQVGQIRRELQRDVADRHIAVLGGKVEHHLVDPQAVQVRREVLAFAPEANH